MKRENSNISLNKSPKKKQKKSVKISSEVQIKTFNNDESEKKTKNIKQKKQEKKPKLEKPILNKKIKTTLKSINDSGNSSVKVNKVEKLIEKKKKKNIKKSDKMSDKKSENIEKPVKKLIKKEDEVEETKTKPNETVDTEKPDWNEVKKQRKEIKIKRKEQKLKDLYPVHVQVLKLSEKLRLENLPEEEREEICEKIHSLLKGSYQQVVNAHDISRIIQWLLKYSTQEIRNEIILELKPSWSLMFMSKYGKKCLVSACEHCSKDVQKGILDACKGRIIKILSSADTSKLFEKLYSLYATADQKIFFKQEFYSDLYKNSKDPKVKSIQDVYKNDSVMKTATLSAVKKNLSKILDKQLIGSSLVHEVLYEFLSSCSSQDRSEMIQTIRDMSIQLIESKFGSKAGVLCIWHGTNKDRKVIMKSLKEHLKDVFVSENGHLMLMALIDCVDDTILMKKILITEMIKDLQEIVSNEYGRRVLLYLVARRDLKFFHPSDVAYFKEGDGNASSKKSVEVREKELLDYVIEDLFEAIKSDIPFWLETGTMQMVTFAILQSNHDKDMTSVFEMLVDYIMDESIVVEIGENKEVPIVEHPGFHIVAKKMLQSDALFRSRNSNSSLSRVLVSKLNDDVIKRWIKCNRGCFLLVVTAENCEENTLKMLKQKLNKFKEELKNQKSKGATILISKI